MSEDPVDETAQHRFLRAEAGEEAQLVYRVEGQRLVLEHTEVPEGLAGRGLGGRLVRAAVARARTSGETIVPECEYARKWLQEHPGDVADVTIDWTERAEEEATP